MAALAAAWQAQISNGLTVEIGTPTDLLTREHAVYVTGDVSDWNQYWGVTPHTGTGLDGGRDEDFTLTARIYRKRLGGTVIELLADIDPDRIALEAALRADPTLGGALSTSGMAQISGMTLKEGIADDRTRELGLSIDVACRAWIT
jgi:hypothetical protein